MSTDSLNERPGERLGYPLGAATANGAARRAALTAELPAHTPTSLVAYASAGSLLIIGAEEHAAEVADRLAGKLRCTVLVPSTTGKPEPAAAQDAERARTIHAAVSRVSGHLGAFEVAARVDGEDVTIAPSLLTAQKPFDLVLDLHEPRFIAAEVSPPGYYAPGADRQALELALSQIPDMVGEFEKPRYFNYAPDICAHGASGLEGCTRCLSACPTDAIRSIGERIDVDPYLCQGAGTCATACPTGAITYAYPAAANLNGSLREILSVYRDRGGAAAVVLLHDAEAGREWLAANAASLPENVIPWEIEEAGSAGMDTWLAAIAYGARQVAVLCLPGAPDKVRSTVERELDVTRAILAGLGYAEDLVALCSGTEPAIGAGVEEHASAASGIEPATFAPLDEKRTTIRLSVEHLYEQASAPAATGSLPEGAPFGQVLVNRDTCTLCMACASVCPAGAINAGGELPRLDFIEWNCVQCGLCETACPEDAIRLEPRFVYEPRLRRDTRVLNEEQPFHCVSCGKPFATTSVIERMRDKLKGHWMFQDPEAVRRLEMCEDCRVKDMFKDGGGVLQMPDKPD